MGSISFDPPNWLSLAEAGLTLVVLVILAFRMAGRVGVERLGRGAALWVLAGIQVFAWAGWWLVRVWIVPEDVLAPYLLPPANQLILQKMIQGLVAILSGWAAGLALFFLLRWLSVKVFRPGLFQPQDLVLVTIGSVAVGWPAVLVFLAATFCLTIIGMIGLVILRRKTVNDRLVISPFIIPAAILTLVFKVQLLALTHLDKIRF